MLDIFTNVGTGQALMLIGFYAVAAFAGVKLKSAVVFTMWGLSLTMVLIASVTSMGVEVVLLSMIGVVVSIMMVSIIISMY